MKYKTCRDCQEEKSTDLFYKYTRLKDGLSTYCKKCTNIRNVPYVSKYQKNHYVPTATASDKLFLSRIWQSIKNGRKSKGYENIKTKLTTEQFYSFTKNSDFPRLFKDWSKAGRPLCLTPSIDRINPEGHYELGNIQWITFKENASRARTTNKDKCRPVAQYTKDGVYLRTFDSITEALLFLNKSHNSNIGRCCKKQIPSAYGHLWEYVDKPKNDTVS